MELHSCVSRNPEHGLTARMIIVSVLFCSLLFQSSAFGASEATTGVKRPNVVLIMADDLDATASEYWDRATRVGKDDPLKKTRALVRDQGVNFVNAFAPNPICCPSRSSLLTGRYGHNTGVLTNGGDQGGRSTLIKSGGEDHSLAPWLKVAGYRTGLVGKYLNGIADTPTEIPPGWTDWFVFADNVVNEYKGYGYKVNENGTLTYRGYGPEDYSTDYVRDKSVEFIERASADGRPFFLFASPTAPHFPLPPAPRHLVNPYALAPLPQTPNTHEADVSDKPLWLRASAPQRLVESSLWTPVDYRLRQGSLYALDELVEAIIRKLEETGELDNTYIVFMSDNGYNLGSHRLIHKMAPYEESIRIPFTVRGPGIPAGISRSETVVIPDLTSTVLDWAGIQTPTSLGGVQSRELDGASLAPLLRKSPPMPWRREFTIQYLSQGFLNGIGAEVPPGIWTFSGMDIPSYLALRSDEYKLIRWSATTGEQWELYDLRQDPHELRNLLSTPLGRARNKATVERLTRRMLELSQCKGASCRTW